MSSQRKLMSAFIFLVLFNLFAFVRSQSYKCVHTGNYTRNSTYEANLNTLFSSLSTNIEDNGFYNTSTGQNLVRVNGIALCRGDIQLDVCRGCIREATIEIISSCPNERGAILWREFCMLRYSNEFIFGTLSTDPSNFSSNPNEPSMSPDEFIEDLKSLVNSLREKASSGGSLRKVAGGDISSTSSGSQIINGLVQCTPDLSREECISCLMSAEAQLPRFIKPVIGGRVLMPTCNLRYETYPFYNETRLRELGLVPITQPVPSTLTIPPISSLSGNHDNINTTRTIIIVVVLVVVILVIFAGFSLRKRTKKKPKEEIDLDEISFVESLQCDFGNIRAATDDFSEANKLGQGGFGSVYKGKLKNDQEIAVKKLSKGSGQGDLEFKNEVMLLARLQHKNLVRLLGFCVERDEKILVYEYVQNGSLDNFIFDETKRSNLNWDKRYKIIGGIARGILYLHEDSRLMIIHRDLKAGNVLLDGQMNPKIADFGLARLCIPHETQGCTNRIVGTYGYMAPEYVMHGKFSIKSDVFSFGILVLEIISGQKNGCFHNEETVDHLPSSAWKHWRKGTTADLVDPMLIKGISGIPIDILKCIHIALLCVQENAAIRPTMASVVQMLNNSPITLPRPSKPSFFMASGYDSKASLLEESDSNEGNPYKPKENDPSSQNEISVTEFYP